MSIECIKFNPIESGCLIGFADVVINKWVSSSKKSGLMGITIKGCKLFRKNAQMWVAFPSKEVKDGEETKYYTFFNLDTKEDIDELKLAIKDSIKLYLEVNKQKPEEPDLWP